MAAPDIETLFAEAAWRAERTVAVLRLAVALSIAVVFAFTAAPQMPSTDIVLVRQLVLAGATIAGYVLLGFAALWVVASRNFRPWMAWLFSTIDVGLLLISLDAVMANTRMPGYYLAAVPVLWLAPVILAFGALRYDPPLQIYMVVLTVAGLAAIVVLHMAELGMSAGDTPAYLPPLFGASPNAIRFMLLLLYGAVLVAAAFRARRLLARAIAEGTRRANLMRYLPAQVAEGLATISTADMMRGRRQHGAVLFADIRGFTARAEAMDPPALGAFLSEFRRDVRKAVERNGGIVDKYIGDAAMAVFGVPRPGGKDARNALAAARDILAGLDRFNAAHRDEPPVALAIGVHWGEIFVGGIGDEQRLEFSVIGDTVNIAARLQEQAKHGDYALVVSKDLLDAAGEDPSAAGWHPLPPRILRGRQHPTEMFGAK